MSTRLPVLLLLAWLGALAPALAADSGAQKKTREEFAVRLKAVDQTDEKALQDLAAWCRQHALKAEEQQVQTLVLDAQYAKRHRDFAAAPTAQAYQDLLQWCRQHQLAAHADDLQREWARQQYDAKAKALAADDGPRQLELAKWCQAQGLYLEAVHLYRAAVKRDPKRLELRAALAECSQKCKSRAHGLLRRQPVSGYAGPSSWYHLWVPADYVPTKPRPLYIWLHGGHVGAGSADNTVDLYQAIPEFKANLALFPNHQYHFWTHPRELLYLLDTLDDVRLRFAVDPQRIYIMGSSMGGSGTWAMAANFPELFAACSPNSAWWEFTPIEQAAVMPIYINHGSQDQTVPVKWGRDAFAKLKNLPGAKVEYHEGNFPHQEPIAALAAAAKWISQFANPRTFDLDELKARARALPPPPWVNQPQYRWPEAPAAAAGR